jgi:hypothetical protein
METGPGACSRHARSESCRPYRERSIGRNVATRRSRFQLDHPTLRSETLAEGCGRRLGRLWRRGPAGLPSNWGDARNIVLPRHRLPRDLQSSSTVIYEDLPLVFTSIPNTASDAGCTFESNQSVLKVLVDPNLGDLSRSRLAGR